MKEKSLNEESLIVSPKEKPHNLSDQETWSELMERLLQEHLHALNDLLNQKDISPAFSRFEVINGQEMSYPWLAKTENVQTYSNGVAFARIPAVFGKRSDGVDVTGQYYPALFEAEREGQFGALQLLITPKPDSISSSAVSPSIYIKPELLSKINDELKARGRILLKEALSQKPDGDYINITDYGLDDTNSKFFTILVLASDRFQIPLIFNRVSVDGSEGDVYSIRFSDGKYGLIKNKRPLIGVECIECPRGMANALNRKESKYRELWEETGLDAEYANVYLEKKVQEDPEITSCFPTLHIINFDSLMEMSDRDKKDLTDEEDFEYLVRDKYTPKEVIGLVKNGDICDPHSLSALFLSLLYDQALVFASNDLKKLSLVFEYKYNIPLASKHLSLPRGPLNQGDFFGQVLSDSGKSRVFYQINEISPTELDSNREYLVLTLEEVINKSKEVYFDIITLSAIFKYLLTKGYLVLNKNAPQS